MNTKTHEIRVKDIGNTYQARCKGSKLTASATAGGTMAAQVLARKIWGDKVIQIFHLRNEPSTSGSVEIHSVEVSDA